MTHPWWFLMHIGTPVMSQVLINYCLRSLTKPYEICMIKWWHNSTCSSIINEIIGIISWCIKSFKHGIKSQILTVMIYFSTHLNSLYSYWTECYCVSASAERGKWLWWFCNWENRIYQYLFHLYFHVSSSRSDNQPGINFCLLKHWGVRHAMFLRCQIWAILKEPYCTGMETINNHLPFQQLHISSTIGFWLEILHIFDCMLAN